VSSTFSSSFADASLKKLQMANRIRVKTITFKKSFEIENYDGLLPESDYQVETEDEFLQGVSFVGYRRILTLLHLPPVSEAAKFGPTLKVDPNDLDAAFFRDLASCDSPNDLSGNQNVPNGTT